MIKESSARWETFLPVTLLLSHPNQTMHWHLTEFHSPNCSPLCLFCFWFHSSGFMRSAFHICCQSNMSEQHLLLWSKNSLKYFLPTYHLLPPQPRCRVTVAILSIWKQWHVPSQQLWVEIVLRLFYLITYCCSVRKTSLYATQLKFSSPQPGSFGPLTRFVG